jgi:hypothetical protein
MSSGIDRQPPVCCYAKHANFLTMRLQSFRGFWKMVNVITLTSPVNASTALHLPKKDKQLLTSCLLYWQIRLTQPAWATAA